MNAPCALRVWRAAGSCSGTSSARPTTYYYARRALVAPRKIWMRYTHSSPVMRQSVVTARAPREGLALELNEQERDELEGVLLEASREPARPIQLHRLSQPVPPSELSERARETKHDICVRLAHRLAALRELPYMAVLNPHISHIHNLYYNSFRVLSSLPPPQSEKENLQFVEILEHLVASHSNTIPTLAKGYAECCPRFVSREDIDEALIPHLEARIGTRLLAEHHILLTKPLGPNFNGTVQLDLCPAEILKNCANTVSDLCSLRYGISPELEIEEGAEVRLAYVPVHLEYIFTELLKNAFRALCEGPNPDPPVLATIVPTGQGVIIRLRDHAGGIAPEVEREIFHFGASTFSEKHDPNESVEISSQNSLAGLGYGLPLSKAYAEFFGGRLQVQSYWGIGTDVYLTLKSPASSGYRKEVL